MADTQIHDVLREKKSEEGNAHGWEDQSSTTAAQLKKELSATQAHRRMENRGAEDGTFSKIH